MTLLFDRWTPLLEPVLARSGAMKPFVPAADVLATEKDVTVHLDVPGFTQDDLDIELHDDVLTVRGSRTAPELKNDEDTKTWARFERGFGRFERTLRVPAGLDPES